MRRLIVTLCLVLLATLIFVQCVSTAQASGRFLSHQEAGTLVVLYEEDSKQPMITIYEDEPPKIHSITKISDTELVIK